MPDLTEVLLAHSNLFAQIGNGGGGSGDKSFRLPRDLQLISKIQLAKEEMNTSWGSQPNKKGFITKIIPIGKRLLVFSALLDDTSTSFEYSRPHSDGDTAAGALSINVDSFTKESVVKFTESMNDRACRIDNGKLLIRRYPGGSSGSQFELRNIETGDTILTVPYRAYTEGEELKNAIGDERGKLLGTFTPSQSQQYHHDLLFRRVSDYGLIQKVSLRDSGRSFTGVYSRTSYRLPPILFDEDFVYIIGASQSGSSEVPNTFITIFDRKKLETGTFTLIVALRIQTDQGNHIHDMRMVGQTERQLLVQHTHADKRGGSTYAKKFVFSIDKKALRDIRDGSFVPASQFESIYNHNKEVSLQEFVAFANRENYPEMFIWDFEYNTEFENNGLQSFWLYPPFKGSDALPLANPIARMIQAGSNIAAGVGETGLIDFQLAHPKFRSEIPLPWTIRRFLEKEAPIAENGYRKRRFIQDFAVIDDKYMIFAGGDTLIKAKMIY